MLNVCLDECAFGAMRLGLREMVVCGYRSLCYGKLVAESFDEARRATVDRAYKLCSQNERDEFMAKEENGFNTVIDTAKKEKALRIWYANNSADKCGLYHIIHTLQGVECRIFAVEMPMDIGHTDASREKSWGEAESKDFSACLRLARELTSEERNGMALKWEKLVRENSELRVLDGGEVVSVSADHLDGEILSCAPSGHNFKAGDLVGIAMGRLTHYITCDFAEWRIEELIGQGKLTVIERDKDPEYWNMMILRKN